METINGDGRGTDEGDTVTMTIMVVSMVVPVW